MVHPSRRPSLGGVASPNRLPSPPGAELHETNFEPDIERSPLVLRTQSYLVLAHQWERRLTAVFSSGRVLKKERTFLAVPFVNFGQTKWSASNSSFLRRTSAGSDARILTGVMSPFRGRARRPSHYGVWLMLT